MKKLTIISIITLVALVACSPQSSQPTSALPIWERKSAPAVILGRYVDWQPGDNSNPPGFWGNQANLKGNASPEIIVDSTAGRFTMVWDICYPLKHDFQGWSLMLFPGDTIKLDFNRAAFAEYEAYTRPPADSVCTLKLQELWKKAVHIEGGSFEQPLPIHMKEMVLGFSREYSEAHLHAVMQVVRGHRKTDLFDRNEFPPDFALPNGRSVCLPYLAALIRLADEIDVDALRSSVLLFDVDSFESEEEVMYYYRTRACERMEITRDTIIMHVRTEDPAVKEALEKLKDKIQETLELCTRVVETTPYILTQHRVEMKWII